MATIWNAADETTNIALSDTNHTATSIGGGNNGIRSIGQTHSTGKWYFEFSNILSPGGSGAYGLASATDTLGAGSQFYIDPGGHLRGAGGSVAIGSAPDGHLLAIAVDLDISKAWARYDAGSWVGDGTAGADPATGVHGFDITGAGTLFIYTWLQNNPGHVTMNAGDSAFAQAVPANFIAWDTPVVFTYAQGRVIA